jgi:hypothetical protein
MLTWEQEWLVYFLTELLDIMLIFHVGATFGPMQVYYYCYN